MGVQTIAFFPFAYQLIADVLSRSAGLEQAARNLGAAPGQCSVPSRCRYPVRDWQQRR